MTEVEITWWAALLPVGTPLADGRADGAALESAPNRESGRDDMGRT